ncbi:Hpt domain-containing protein [Celeribacter sp. SCSIO 80788]|jgi:chemotaxis protein histidine kinase CheA|uniref:Hpt domain-containing protein n=1 Tax=Celeribacter sp. SCSIO 80788 TaxID=3117013 RepID=UPI003DA27A9A
MPNKSLSDSAIRQRLAEAIGRTRQNFIDDLIVKIPEIEGLQARINARSNDRDALDQLGFLTHRMSGIAATVGFPEIGERAGEIHDVLSHFDQSDRQLVGLSQQLETLLDLMEDAIVDEM